MNGLKKREKSHSALTRIILQSMFFLKQLVFVIGSGPRPILLNWFIGLVCFRTGFFVIDKKTRTLSNLFVTLKGHIGGMFFPSTACLYKFARFCVCVCFRELPGKFLAAIGMPALPCLCWLALLHEALIGTQNCG